MPVLSVENLCVEFQTEWGWLPAVEDVSFSVSEGEILGLVGESGSGKSVSGLALMGLIDAPGRVSGSVQLGGKELVGLTEADWRRKRGKDIAMIFQDPMTTLNPTLRIETQMVEAVRSHDRVSESAARERAVSALEKVGISAASDRIRGFPHQFSGGMRQRVAIATALLNRPLLIIADEPTTALDVTIQSQILAQVQDLCAESGTSLIWITHDLAVVAGLADRVAVMYAGRLVEEGSVDDVLDQPMHPYTVGLINSIPSHNAKGTKLRQIPGMGPSLVNRPDGCAFMPRCHSSTDRCEAKPEATHPVATRRIRCWHPNTLELQ